MLLYFESEQFLTKDPKNASLRSRIFDLAESKQLRSNPKQVFALISSTLKYKKFIKEIIKNSKILKDKAKLPKKLTADLTLLLVHDLVFTKSGRIQSSKHPVKDFIISYKTRIHSEFTKLKLKYKIRDFSELVEDDNKDNDYTPIRWVRINTIKTTKEQLFAKDPFFQKLVPVDSIEKVKEAVGSIYHDEFIPNLVGLNPKDKVTNSVSYKDGRIIIQDRASCFPAHILSPQPGDKVIDSCAAPGNKTTHTASYVKNTKGSIIAFEKNQKRSLILKKMSNKAGASKCITVNNQDFTTTNPKDFKDVVGFIVDPSCSGSGIFGRENDDKRNKEENTNEEHDEQEESLLSANEKTRLAKLSSFQFTIVKHALSFPGAKKLVYSTCSIHAEENEQVVIDLLNDKSVRVQGWSLCERSKVIPNWNRRGWVKEFENAGFKEESKKLAEGCIRSLPKIDGGIGFFAAAFERD